MGRGPTHPICRLFRVVRVLRSRSEPVLDLIRGRGRALHEGKISRLNIIFAESFLSPCGARGYARVLAAFLVYYLLTI